MISGKFYNFIYLIQRYLLFKINLKILVFNYLLGRNANGYLLFFFFFFLGAVSHYPLVSMSCVGMICEALEHKWIVEPPSHN